MVFVLSVGNVLSDSAGNACEPAAEAIVVAATLLELAPCASLQVPNRFG